MLNITGLDANFLQMIILPFIGVGLMGVIFFVFFREITDNDALAALGTILLYSHGDFLYVSLRGSHEKITWPLAAVSIFLLLRSIRSVRSPQVFATCVVLFYVAVFALASTNFFFSSSFILALGLSLLFASAWLRITRRKGLSRHTEGFVYRYLLLLGASLAVLAIVIFYAYPPAKYSLLTLNTLQEQLLALFLSYEPQHNPYEIVSYGWVSRQLYFWLTIINYVLLVTSGLTLLDMLVKRKFHEPRHFMVALFYVSFSVQLFLGAIADFTGLLGANMQLRLLPTFILFAIALTLIGLQQLLQTGRRARFFVLAAIPLLLAIFSFNALLKATNEPLVSNYWFFFTPQERAGMEWANANLRNSSIWLDQDYIRLHSLWYQIFDSYSTTNWPDSGIADTSTRMFLVSSANRQLSVRQQRPLPIDPDALRIYDNGAAELYRLRAVTPFQK